MKANKKKHRKGLGDLIADGTKKLGIRPCESCKKRQKKLNDWFPFEAEKKR